MTFHCFFEQSGTFKNEFKKLGYEAYDYDILNDFGETDYQIDLFKEIEDAYERERRSSTESEKTIRSWRSFPAYDSRIRLCFILEDSITELESIPQSRKWNTL